MRNSDLWNALRRFDYQHLDVDNLGSWPLALRGLVLVGVAALVIGAGWFLLLSGRYEQFNRAVQNEVQLTQQFRRQVDQTDHPAVLDAELATLRSHIEVALTEVPNRLDLPELIDAINRLAAGAGLSIEQITPDAERLQGRLMATPIQVSMRGGYHSLGAFIAELSTLPSLISLHRLTIKRQAPAEPGASADNALLITLEARAYRQTSAGEE
ncbi:hypothetical protein BGP77_17125 [Saccharospirillum sp. MSK14-1]|uniref:type 4a pilus biogenesis protein PilO n=1 Tax=Saccharospirillum sp. MSK14-1 TaxID=1897632 RepID=UPI000D3C42EA|nr:type 4a pilus biogenesis protein PilO [Saccharospirillum sp. MSK14-1]PTY38168.1 hypothetical protein BGP77_17125 [Saccharospirillum sp. MSK14-1]